MEAAPDGTPREPTLPDDDGRDPREQWPWRRTEDYTPTVRWGRCAFLCAAVAGAGSALTAAVSAGLVGYLVAVAGGLVAAGIAARNDRTNRWPEWRLRNLVAADYRANRSLAEVDPEFAREIGLGRPEPDVLPPVSADEPGDGRARPSLSGLPTTGPTVPWK